MSTIAERARYALTDWRPSPMSAEQEIAFDRHCKERFARLATIFAWSTLLCGLLWWPSDYLVYQRLPAYIGPFRMLRETLTVLAIAFLLAARVPRLRRHLGSLFIGAFLIVCWTLGYCGGLLGGPEGVMFQMTYVIGFGTVPLPVRLSTRVALTSAICAVIVAGCLLPFPAHRVGPHVAMSLSFFVWVAGMSVTFGHVSFLVLRSNFSQAALLLENNAMLEERVAERTRELRELISRLETTREEERSRIARELHDQLGQELTAQRLTLAIAEECLDGEPATARAKLAEMRHLLDGMMTTVRALIGDLRPWILHDLGLGEAAQWLARRTEELAGLRCELRVDGDPTSLDAEQSAAVFRILQESLTNVAKHALAKRVSIEITTGRDAFELCVADDGIGPGDRGHGAGFGVVGMRERAHALGGEFSLREAANGGTEVRCRIPLPRTDGTPS